MLDHLAPAVQAKDPRRPLERAQHDHDAPVLADVGDRLGAAPDHVEIGHGRRSRARADCRSAPWARRSRGRPRRAARSPRRTSAAARSSARAARRSRRRSCPSPLSLRIHPIRIRGVATTASTALERDLKALLGEDAVLPGNTRAYLTDATESRNLRGRADAVALPDNAEAVAKGRGLVLRPRRADHPPRRRHRLHRRRRPARWRRGPFP